MVQSAKLVLKIKGVTMALASDIKDLRDKLTTLKSETLNEDTIKNALIMPFIKALGYDVFNPSEVKVEYATENENKVDYAVFKDSKITMLFQYDKLEGETSDQLAQSFNTLDVKFAILTNGIEYRFFTDADKDGDLDDAPFITFNLGNYEEAQVAQLQIFTKEMFDIQDAQTNAKLFKQVPNLTSIIGGALGGASTVNIVNSVVSKLETINNPIVSNLVSQHRGTIVNTLNSFLSNIGKKG